MNVRALAALCALVAAGGVARADAFDHLGDGAPLYLAARPVALVGALQRVGVDQLTAVQRLRRQLGGIDPFNPAILAAPGIDVAAPLVMSLFAPAGPNHMETRIAATLRDPAMFSTFIDAVAASGRVKLTRVDAASALGKAGVIATGNPTNDSVLVIRTRDADAVVDFVMTSDGKKAPSPADVLRRFPLAPAKPLDRAHGARRLFTVDAAAVVYVDARRWEPFLRAKAANDQRDELRWAEPSQRAAIQARWRARDKRCAVWMHPPATFDDAALALTAAPDGLSLTWAWGTQSGAPLGGLKLQPVDDAAFDADAIGRDATAVMALYAASLQPFLALKRSGPFASLEAYGASLDGCESLAGATVFFRSWPMAIGMLAAARADASPMAALQKSVSGLRNVVVALRDLTAVGPRGAIAGTFDSAARPKLEALLTASGGAGAVTPMGKRSPTIYSLALPGLPRPLSAALEALAAGRLGFTVADSEESLSWAYRSAEPPASPPAGNAATSAILRLVADLAVLPKLGPLFNAGRDEQQLLETLARLRRVDGDLVADGDLFRLTLRSALKQ